MLKKVDVWLFAAWLVAAIATTGSLFLSEVMLYTPCVLCWYQRIFMYPLVVLLFVATYRKDAAVLYYAMPLTVIGGGIAIYHIVTQKVPRISEMAACGPVSCQDDYLNWFGWITIPMLALAAFVLIALALLQAWRLEKRA